MKYINSALLKRAAIVGTLLVVPPAVGAVSFHGVDKLQVHGFITQGYFLTSDNAVLGESDNDQGSLDFHEIGLNGSFQFSNTVSFRLQGLFRNTGAVEQSRIDYAVLDWRVGNWGDGEWGVRLGRIKNPMGLYNETRDVAFTRPSVFLPQGIYYDRSRNLVHSTGGGQLYLNLQTEIGFFEFKSNVGRAENDNKELKMAIFGFDTAGELVSKRENYWGQLKFESLSGDLELAFSYADVVLDYKPGAGDIFRAGATRFRPAVLSAQYSWSQLILTAEYLRQQNRFNHLAPFPDANICTESYYLQGEYLFNREIKGILRFGAHYLDKDDRDGKKAASTTGIPGHRGFTEDWMIGLSWLPDSSWQIQVEYHRINGTSWLPALANPDLSKLEQRWDLLAATVSFRF